MVVRSYFTFEVHSSSLAPRERPFLIPNVGIYLPWHVFNHGQLYVALSRGVSQNSTKLLIKEGKIEGEDWDFTKNVVFKDILLS